MIAALFLAAALQTTPEPSDLLFSEAWACSAMAKAGQERGLEPGLATRIALETVLGTALMAEASGESMAQIAGRVASPNGTTEAGLAVLDKDRALDRLVAATLEAAAKRGEELAAAARRG